MNIKLLELVPKELQNKYGKIFMGEYPDFASKQDSEFENNTDPENDILDLFNAWVHAHTREELDSVQDKLEPFIPDLIQIANENKWLKCKPGTVIYRGTVIRGENGKAIWEKILLAGESIADKKVTNTPKRKLISSWTTSSSSAEDFRRTRTSSLTIDISHHLSTSGNISDEEALYIVSVIGKICEAGHADLRDLLRSKEVEEIELKYPNLKQDAFDSLSGVEYRFPAVLRYEVKSSDLVLFPGDDLSSLISYHKGSSLNESEVVFVNLPGQMDCSIYI